MKKSTTPLNIGPYPIFKTAAEMAVVAGIGENKLRELMDKGELGIFLSETADS